MSQTQSLTEEFSSPHPNVRIGNIIDALDVWAHHMQLGDYEAVTKLYSHGAHFMGTLANSVVVEDDQYKEYFIDFLRKVYEGDAALKIVRTDLKASLFDIYGDANLVMESESDFDRSKENKTDIPINYGVASGQYDFIFTGKNGVETHIPARFTFRIHLDRDEEPVIAGHHSSRNPTLNSSIRDENGEPYVDDPVDDWSPSGFS